jgi:ABC-2 type transport system ATP-binding protein
MCSHILSDIEVLCDNVAILKGGRLAHSGSLNDLRARDTNSVEIIASGTDAQTFKQNLNVQADVQDTPSGLRIEVADEKEVDAVLAALRQVNGKLVSVQPVRQSLEELFM